VRRRTGDIFVNLKYDLSCGLLGSIPTSIRNLERRPVLGPRFAVIVDAVVAMWAWPSHSRTLAISVRSRRTTEEVVWRQDRRRALSAT
jgi:hypothetical protein